MGHKTGKCTRFGECFLADDYELQTADSANFICGNPDCKSPLTEVKDYTGPGSSLLRRRILGGVASLVFIAIAIYSWIMIRDSSNQAPQSTTPTVQDESDSSKTMQAWIDEFSTAAPPKIGANASGDYLMARQAADELQSRRTLVQSLKDKGTVIGSEYGLLNASSAGVLSQAEGQLLELENNDRRILFTFIAIHSDPAVSYERVANEYSINQWKEWPPAK